MLNWNQDWLRTGQLLSRYSTYEIGGEARFMALPRSAEEFREALELAASKGIVPILFGMGSNILFPDAPDRDAMFISTREHAEIRLDGDRLFVSGGTPMSALAVIGHELGLADFEFTFLLPGTVGGGIYMNAKYFDRHISDALDLVYYIDASRPADGIRTIPRERCGFGYKKSIFQQNGWFIVGAEFKLSGPAAAKEGLPYFGHRAGAETAFSHSDLKAFAAHYTGWLQAMNRPDDPALQTLRNVVRDRMGKMHFAHPSCGSVFKNDYSVGEPIGKLSDRINLRGMKRGHAMVSPVHGNVIQNRGGAKAADVLDLIRYMQEAFDRHYGFVPEPEVVLIPSETTFVKP
ncbi:UDP-N-acetylmuramate dehydrogenase [Paenibacillus macerans]|uniref:UDP-N-acetylmuramate dehydrogenase n=1 Tax=Paenibacillus macerans TaxID=44252 RepID=UPI003D31CA3B